MQVDRVVSAVRSMRLAPADPEVPGVASAVQLRGVSARSSAGTTLAAVTLEVAAGSIHALLGENGAGCSEVLAVLGGYLPIEAGELLIGGEAVQFWTPKDAARLGIAVIRGEPATVPQMSVADNVFLGIERARGWLVRRDRVLLDARALLSRLGLEMNPTRELRELSTGERRVVQLARELARGSKILLLDDIFAGLSEADLKTLEKALKRMASEGVTVIIATHRVVEIRRLASIVSTFSRGHCVASRLVDAALDSGQLVGDLVSEIASVARSGREALSLSGEALRVIDWSVWHPVDPNRLVVDSASFVVHRGEIVALAGLSGSLRSELALSLFGRSYGSRTAGELLLAGNPVTAQNPQEAIAAGLGLATDTSVRYDLNLLGGIPTRVSPAALARLARLGVIDPDRDYRTAAALPGIAALAKTDKTSPSALAIETLTLWLEIRPTAVILDLPTEGATATDTARLKELIVRLAAGGTGVLLVSNDIDEILALSDRVYPVVEGTICPAMPSPAASPAELLRRMLGLSPP